MCVCACLLFRVRSYSELLSVLMPGVSLAPFDLFFRCCCLPLALLTTLCLSLMN